MSRAVGADVVEQVRDDDIEQHGVGEDWREGLRDVDRDRPFAKTRSEPIDCRLDDRPQLMRLEIRMEAARRDLAEIEEAAHESVEPGGLGIDHVRGITACLVRPDDFRIGETTSGRSDAREWRSE